MSLDTTISRRAPYKANRATLTSTLCKGIWMITISTWRPKPNGSIGRGVWWIKSWSNPLSSRMRSEIRNEVLIGWQMITRVWAELGKITNFKSRNKLGSKSINGSSRTGTRVRFLVHIGKNLNNKSNWSFETSQTSGRGMITRSSTSNDKSTRPGSWTTSSWKCSRMNRIILSNLMTPRISTRIRRGCKPCTIKRWRISNLTKERISSSSTKICLTSSLKSRIRLKCTEIWAQLRKISIKSIWMHSKIMIHDSILWCQGCSTQSMWQDQGLWQQAESRCWVHQVREAARIPWNTRSVTIWSKLSSNKSATTTEGRGTNLESPLEIRKNMEPVVPKWLLLLLVDTAIQSQLVITISQRGIGFCPQPTFTKLKPKYIAEVLAPTLTKHVPLEPKLTPGVDLNSCKEIHLLQIYIRHQVAPYPDMNHNPSTAEEALARSISHLQASNRH